MAFIDRVIGPDEKLIGIMSVHWIYGAKGLAWFAGFVALGIWLNSLFGGWSLHLGARGEGLLMISHYAVITCTIIGATLLLFYLIMMVTTELGLTTKRIIYKRGWLMVDVKESDLEEIKAAEVDNGLFGRILNYGYIEFDARFVANTRLPAIRDPYRFVKALNEARSTIKEGELGFIHGHVQEVESVPHNMKEDRYHAIEDNPAQALANMMTDTADDIDEKLHYIEKDSDQIKRSVEKGKLPEGHSAETKTPKQNKENTKSKPVIFPRDLKKQKKLLRDKMKSVFKRNTNKKSDDI